MSTKNTLLIIKYLCGIWVFSAVLRARTGHDLLAPEEANEEPRKAGNDIVSREIGTLDLALRVHGDD